MALQLKKFLIQELVNWSFEILFYCWCYVSTVWLVVGAVLFKSTLMQLLDLQALDLLLPNLDKHQRRIDGYQKMILLKRRDEHRQMGWSWDSSKIRSKESCEYKTWMFQIHREKSHNFLQGPDKPGNDRWSAQQGSEIKVQCWNLAYAPWDAYRLIFSQHKESQTQGDIVFLNRGIRHFERETVFKGLTV